MMALSSVFTNLNNLSPAARKKWLDLSMKRMIKTAEQCLIRFSAALFFCGQNAKEQILFLSTR